MIRKEANVVRIRLKELNIHMRDILSTIDKVTKAKEEKCKEIDIFVENI
jgi:ATP-dependent 26S proteasome regulatory subunit